MKRISLDNLLHTRQNIDYQEQYEYIMKLLEKGQIKPVKVSKSNGKKPALYREYWIVEEQKDYSNYIDEIKYTFYTMISVDYYLAHPDIYEKDRIWVLMLNEYLKKHTDALLTPESLNERSFETSQYQFIAADGSSISFSSFPRFTLDEYYISEGHSASGFYSMHINDFYDLNRHIYTDALTQPAHQKDEFAAFCQLVDSHVCIPDTKTGFIGDRGYCSYNNMAHVIEKEQYFLFRTKDINRKGLIGNFNLPDTPEFDISVNVTLTRSHRKSIKIQSGFYRRYIDPAASFDHIKYGSDDTYDLTFRIVRFAISENTYECIVTNRIL